MRIIPAIDIIDGKCVRLSKGDYTTKKVYNKNPLEVAKNFEANGIEYLHVVDLDGAKSQQIVNYKVLESICANTNLKVDFGGGLKSDKDVNIAFESGANQITGGSIAVKNPSIFKEWITKYGSDKIILGADCLNRKIATFGWLESSELDVVDFISNYDGVTYEGTLYYQSSDATHAYWVANNNLLPTANMSSVPNINTTDGSTVELYSWSSEDECIDLYHYKVIGGGHDWPGTFGNMDIVSHEKIWEHLSEYGMSGKLDCKSSHVSSPLTSSTKRLIKVIDALGREVNHTTNQIRFHIYDDGSVEKKFVVE